MAHVDLPFAAYAVSDIHSECQRDMGPERYVKEIPPVEVLILAGDVGWFSEKRLRRFFVLCAAKHALVVFVAGNHEYWHGHTPATMRVVCEESGVRMLENDTLEYKGVVIAGTTMWTAARTAAGDPLGEADTQQANDFRFIPDWTLARCRAAHGRAVAFLTQTLEKCSGRAQRCIVVTHHAPSFSGVRPEKRATRFAGFFASALDSLLEHPALQCWVFGHTHSSTRRLVLGQDGNRALLLSHCARDHAYGRTLSLATCARGMLTGPDKS